MSSLAERPAPPRATTRFDRALTENARTARIAVSLCFLLNGILFASWVGRIPAVQERLGLSHATLGLALLCLAIGAVVAMPIGGWACGRFGSHRVTQFSALCYCAVLPALALAPSLPWLMAALLVFGAFHGAFDVAMNAQAVAVEEHYFPRPIMSSFHALWSTGGLLGAAAAGAVAAADVPPWLHFLVAGLGLGSLGCLLALPRLLPSFGGAARAASPRPEPRSQLSPALLALGGIAFCVMMGEGAMADWSAIFLREYSGASEALAAAGYGAFSIAMAIGRFAGDGLTARLGGARLLRLGGLLAAGGLACPLLFPHTFLALAGFAAVGAGFATIVPVVFSHAGRLPGLSPGAALATVTTLGYTGFLLGPPTIGFLGQTVGLRLALWLVVGVSLLLAVLAGGINRQDHAAVPDDGSGWSGPQP